MPVVTSVKDCKTILMKVRWCFVCLRPQHQAKDCDPKRKCRHCHKHHHQSICDVVNKSDNLNNSGSIPQESTSTNTTDSLRDKKAVLLRTTRAVASNKDGSKSVNILVLFDNGSQRSYITESVKSKLNLLTQKRKITPKYL